jgi:hypothetical protein
MQRRFRRSFRSALAGVGALLLAAGCGGDETCVVVPCPLPLAVSLTVTSAAGGAVAGAVVTVSGRVSGTIPCSASGGCDMLGPAGTYELDITAPGYRAAHRTVVVPGTNPDCGCATTTPQHVDVALTPA